MRLRTVVGGFVSASVLVSAACTTGGGPGSSVSNATLRLAYQADISSFDPDNNFEVAGLGAIMSVYEGLVQYEPGTTHIVGRLAKSWTVSPDGKTYTFTLRDGVKFHDGATMTSSDVVASFQRRISNNNFDLSYFLADVANMSTPDPQTVVINLTAPQASLLDSLSSPWGPKVVGPDALKNHAGSDHSSSWLNDNADGTGPFKLTQLARGQRYLLQRFDGYWGAKPYFATVQISIVPDIGQLILQLRGGTLDAVLHGYPFPQLASLPAGLSVAAYDDLGLELGWVNVAHLNRDQRRRLVAALNPARWVSQAFGRYGEAPHSLFPVKMLDPGKPQPWLDIASESQVSLPPIQIVYTQSEAGVQQRVTDLLIAQLASSGIQASGRAVPDDEVFNYIRDPKRAPVDLLLAQNNPDDAHPSAQTGLFFSTGGGLNVFGYSNPQADALWNQAANINDQRARDSMFQQGAQLVFDDGAFVPLANIKDVMVVQGYINTIKTRPAIPWTFDFALVTRS